VLYPPNAKVRGKKPLPNYDIRSERIIHFEINMLRRYPSVPKKA
jgi:hypothetical protein